MVTFPTRVKSIKNNQKTTNQNAKQILKPNSKKRHKTVGVLAVGYLHGY